MLFTRPEHAKEIFAGDPEVFHAGKGNAILGPIMGEHSLLLQDGGEHKRARKLLMPAFNGHALRGYEALVTEVARAEVARWRPGEEFRALDRMNALTLEVILRVVFGVTDEAPARRAAPAGQRDGQHQPGGAARLGLPAAAAVRPVEAHGREPARARPADVRRDPRAPHGARPRRAHRRAVPADPGARRRGRRDALDDTELRDQLVTLLLAGHETTATALAWALYELGRDPELLARARAAADEPATTPGWTRCSRSRCGCTR